MKKNLQTVAEKILQRRLQMIVHSYIYYVLNDNIVSDAVWMRWAKELEKMQKEHPEEAKKVKFAGLFSDWDGSTGFHLAQAADDKAIGKARYLLANRRKR